MVTERKTIEIVLTNNDHVKLLVQILFFCNVDMKLYAIRMTHVRTVMCCLYTPLQYRRRGQGSSAALHWTDWSTLTAGSHYPVGCNRTYQCMIVVGYG